MLASALQDWWAGAGLARLVQACTDRVSGWAWAKRPQAGKRMHYRSDELLERRLDMLEGRGRDALTAVARRLAWTSAMQIAACASVAVPAVLLGAALFRPIAVWPAVALSVAVPPLVLVAVYAVRSARFRVDRSAALALLDRAFRLKDRAVTAAEFVQTGGRDGFREAALQEAQPWLDRAAVAPIEGLPRAPQPGRRALLFPLVAALLLAGALSIGTRQHGHDRGGEPTLIRGIATAIGIAPAETGVETGRASSESAARPSARNASAASGGASGSNAPALNASGTLPGGAAAGTSAPADGGSHAGAAEGTAGSPPSSSGPAGAAGVGGRSPATAEASRQPGDRADNGRDGLAQDAKGTEPGAAESRATAPMGAQGGAAAVPSPFGSAPGAARNSAQRDGQQRSGARNPSQSDQQSGGSGSAGSSNNNSQQGTNRGNGQEGIKRARGSSSLMLAVPMQDRVIGTVNVGRVSSTARNAAPQALPSGVVAAQLRGSGQAQAGRIRHRPRTVQEDHMLEAYFRRSGVDR